MIATPQTSTAKAMPICDGVILWSFKIDGKVTKFIPTAVANRKKLKYRNLVWRIKIKFVKLFNICLLVIL
jgi:hypothetical protein